MTSRLWAQRHAARRSASQPPLTTVAIPQREIGAEAARTLLALLRGEPDVRERTLLPTKLVSAARPLARGVLDALPVFRVHDAEQLAVAEHERGWQRVPGHAVTAASGPLPGSVCGTCWSAW